ncbi:MAG TPA: MBOAT family protein [Candidatus Methylomirabilis sp.]|nr:MBOAT family protein [Candidatus Methylomirabilis sp.]
MLFNSWTFPPFLAVVLLLYYALSHRRQNIMLLLASYFFYACWDWRFLGLLLLSTSVDWTLANLIEREPTRRGAKRWVAASVAANLCFLGFFKYFNFFVDSADALLQAIGLAGFSRHLLVVLPVGISFYTFQSISYIVDVYRGEVKPARNPIDFALFVAFFPHMVAGPIMPSRALLPQMQQPRHTTRAQVREGLWLMLWGFFKKLVVGDNLAAIVGAVYGAPAATAGQVLLGTYAFAYQIYCDFSGYSDIARGTAKLMGFELMLNFNQPYLAVSPSDFWRRWHISLSTWLRNYLYIPLGGNRRGTLRTQWNLMITMLLGGLWHGAAWNFVLWGMFHGFLLIGYRLLAELGATRRLEGRLGRLASQVLMFHLVCYGWLLFRATSFAQIAGFTGALLGGRGGLALPRTQLAILVALVLPLWVVELWVRNADDPVESLGWQWGLGPLACAMLAVAIVVLAPPGTRSFIYFQF